MKDELQVQFLDISDEEKKVLLDVLGYEVNKKGIVIIKETNKAHICPITEEKILFENASILPWNSNIVINTSALSISEYLSKFRELNT